MTCFNVVIGRVCLFTASTYKAKTGDLTLLSDRHSISYSICKYGCQLSGSDPKFPAFNLQAPGVALHSPGYRAAAKQLLSDPSDAISEIKNAPKSTIFLRLCPGLAGAAYTLPKSPSWWGGARCPLSKNPTPILGPLRFQLQPSSFCPLGVASMGLRVCKAVIPGLSSCTNQNKSITTTPAGICSNILLNLTA